MINENARRRVAELEVKLGRWRTKAKRQEKEAEEEEEEKKRRIGRCHDRTISGGCGKGKEETVMMSASNETGARTNANEFLSSFLSTDQGALLIMEKLFAKTVKKLTDRVEILEEEENRTAAIIIYIE